ncbi:hypothetical protein M3Y97_00549300 [Aphelenchoides bicaudatus]|nr:hypothetical protein M3Y97_00549300 [Aphelenchoides bicaudatus]
MNNWFATISVFHYTIIILLNSEPTKAQYTTVKRSPKFDVKKDMSSFSSFQEPDMFNLDTLAGIGLGKRARTTPPPIARFHPSPVSMNANRFRFLDDAIPEPLPSWSFFNQLNNPTHTSSTKAGRLGQLEVASGFGQQIPQVT